MFTDRWKVIVHRQAGRVMEVEERVEIKTMKVCVLREKQAKVIKKNGETEQVQMRYKVKQKRKKSDC